MSRLQPLLWVLFLAPPLWAGEALPDLRGSRWSGVDDGEKFSVTFDDDGQCAFGGEGTGQGVWRQVGAAVYFRKNNGGVYLGELGPDRLHGVAWDRQGREWKWNLRQGGGGQAQPQALTGDWSEDFGKPGETDVTYHDQYRVDIDEDGSPRVKIVNRDQKIENVKIIGKRLTFRHFTSFWVEYDLTLQPDGDTLLGAAKTPDRTVNITWRRVKPAAKPQTGRSMVGKWVEDFGKPGETDVNYHDQYWVSVDGDGKAHVKPAERNETIADEKIEGDRLSFRLQTSFWIEYDLKLQPDGDTLIGVAKTPHRTINITWRRVK